jgi:hypothetical protein
MLPLARPHYSDTDRAGAARRINRADSCAQWWLRALWCAVAIDVRRFFLLPRMSDEELLLTRRRRPQLRYGKRSRTIEHAFD